MKTYLTLLISCLLGSINATNPNWGTQHNEIVENICHKEFGMLIEPVKFGNVGFQMDVLKLLSIRVLIQKNDDYNNRFALPRHMVNNQYTVQQFCGIIHENLDKFSSMKVNIQTELSHFCLEIHNVSDFMDMYGERAFEKIVSTVKCADFNFYGPFAGRQLAEYQEAEIRAEMHGWISRNLGTNILIRSRLRGRFW